MTRDELYNAMSNKANESGFILKIKHINNKDVEFWPTSWQEESIYHKFHGYWISIQFKDIIVPETIKIKKEDLASWNIVNSNIEA